MGADGSVVIEVDVDGSEADKEFARLSRSAEKLEKEIEGNKQKKLPLVQRLEQLTVQADAAAAKLDEMQHAPIGTYSAGQIEAQKETVRALGARWDDVQRKVAKCDNEIKKATKRLAQTKDRAGQVAKNANSAAKKVEKMGNATKNANKHMGKFALRVREVTRSALVFTLITKALGAFREWVGKVIQTNDEATAAIARLKGALLTMAQPLVEVIIPAFTYFVNLLAKVITIAAQLFSYVFGKTLNQSKESAEALYEQTEALDGVGKAAEKAAGSLAGFDEINALQTENSAAAGSSGINPDFSVDANLTEGQLKSLLELVKAIGAAILGWKVSRAFGLGLSGALGIILLIYGALQLVDGLKSAFEEGWNLENLLQVNTSLLAIGAGIALLTGSWIPLLVGAIAGIGLSFIVATGHGEEFINGLRQMFEGFVEFIKGVFTGDMESAISSIGEIIDGLTLTLDSVIGSWRDLVDGFLAWLDEKTGGKFTNIISAIRKAWAEAFKFMSEVLSSASEGWKETAEGILLFLSGVFTADWETAWDGITKIFSGSVNTLAGVFEVAINAIIGGLNWLIAQMNKISFDIPDWVPGIGGKSFGINLQPVREFKLPRLATGAVIPPNREFLAVLGDQRSGNNIEAPESLIRQIVREEAGGMNTELLEAILAAVKAGHVMTVDKKVLARTAAQGINDMTIASGKPVLIV